MKTLKSNIARNLTTLRQLNKYSQEDVAEQIGVSRQAVAKWESGESVPDIVNCDALAQLYNVELNDLIHHDQEQTGLNIPPKGKHIFGTVRVGEARTDCTFLKKPRRSVQNYNRWKSAGCFSGLSHRNIRALLDERRVFFLGWFKCLKLP